MFIKKYYTRLIILFLLVFSFTLSAIADEIINENNLPNVFNKITYIDIIDNNSNGILFSKTDDFYNLLCEVYNTKKAITIFRKYFDNSSTFSIIIDGVSYSINGKGFKTLSDQYIANKSGFKNNSIYQKAKSLNISSFKEYEKYINDMNEYKKYHFLKYEDYVDARDKGLFNNIKIEKIYYPLMFPEIINVNVFNEFIRQFYPTFKLQISQTDDYKKYFKAINGYYYRLQLQKSENIPELPFIETLAPSFTYYYMKLLSIESLMNLKLYLNYLSSNDIPDSEKGKAYSLKAIFDTKFIFPLVNDKYHYELGQIRARTADNRPVTVILNPVILCDKLDQYNGIIDSYRKEIINSIRTYYSSIKSEKLTPAYEEKMKQDLILLIEDTIGIDMYLNIYLKQFKIIEF